jgi:hypothetical protein
MTSRKHMIYLALAASGGAMPLHAQTVVASWIQLAPGSSAAALAAGSYGDQPTSLTPTILARAVVSDGACPSIALDGGSAVTMTQRFSAASLTNVPGTTGATNGKTGYPQYFVSPTATAPASFANGAAMATTSWAECESVVPAGHTSALVGGITMKLPLAHPKTILLLADTGCRVNGALAANGGNQQNCSSPTAFPLAYLARLEATYAPDLIVHVGDYFYRDTNCLTNGAETFPGCNTPTSINYETWGDTFDSWNADVLYPMQPLLAAAPWVMVRGNHESCGRGARGWYALLDPHPYSFASVSCAKTSTYPAMSNGTPIYNGDFEPSYLVPASNVNFIVHDSSFSNDSAVDVNMAQNYDADLSTLLKKLPAGSMNIFATHKPSFGLVYGTVGGTTPPLDDGGDFTEQAVFKGGTYAASAFGNGVPDSIGLFLSGHIHQFQTVNMKAGAHLPPQLIVGMGGSLLDADMNTGLVPEGNTDVPVFSQSPVDFTVNKFNGKVATAPGRNALSHDEFGFAVLHATLDAHGNTTGYLADVYETSSASPGRCVINLSPRVINCNF